MFGSTCGRSLFRHDPPENMIANDRILVVEDDAAQVDLIRQVLTESRVSNSVCAVHSGEEAIAYLAGEGKHANRIEHPLPSLVLLDLKLPGMTGFEVLNWIRTHPTFQRLPVVVLTGSGDVSSIQRAYSLGANSYLVKPFTMDELRSLVKSINAYWVILAAKPQF